MTNGAVCSAVFFKCGANTHADTSEFTDSGIRVCSMYKLCFIIGNFILEHKYFGHHWPYIIR